MSKDLSTSPPVYSDRDKPSNDQNLDRSLEKLEWFLDRSIALPGGYRIGVDGLIGLVPGVGDLVSSGISLYLIRLGMKKKLPRLIIYRMYWNVLVDTVLGAIPFFGDIFDFAFKANVKNVALIREYSGASEREKRIGVLKTSAIFIAMAAATILAIMLVVRAFVGLLKFIFG